MIWPIGPAIMEGFSMLQSRAEEKDKSQAKVDKANGNAPATLPKVKSQAKVAIGGGIAPITVPSVKR